MAFEKKKLETTEQGEGRFIPNDAALNDIEINMIAQAIHNATIIPFNEKNSIISKLKCMASDDLCNFFDKHLFISKEEEQSELYIKFAEDMIKILTEQRPMLIEIEKSKKQETIEFNTYHVVSNGRNYKLVGAEKDSDNARIIYFYQIKTYKILENKTFKKRKLKVDKLYFEENVLKEIKAMFPKTFVIK